MKQQLNTYRLSNGLVLLGEHMPWLRSAAFTFLVPSGTCYAPPELCGLASLASEMSQRGCGPYDSRQFLEELDFLGVERTSSITTHHTSFSCAMPSSAFERTLELYSHMVRRPHLPEDQLEDARQLGFQDLRALEDEPSHRCFNELKRFRFPQPFGRTAQGTLEGLQSIQIDDVREFCANNLHASDSILAVAGNFKWSEVCEAVERALGDWNGPATKTLPKLEPLSGGRHTDHASNQTHLALAYDCVPYESPDYYKTRALVGILSDGMSSRLFTEVREKRGLVYSVFATCFSLAGKGSVLCYAGTTTNRAEETLHVLLETIHSLGSGVSEDELARLKVRIKSALVMEQESSAARSHQIAVDWFHLGRVPTRAEVLSEIDSLTCEGLLDHFNAHRPNNFALVTVGSQPLELPGGIVDA
ncbi:MAG: insulinase family protein [Pirellulaceae bacterium]|nr:insulinase family protein [Pirellulaceae bacterium]